MGKEEIEEAFPNLNNNYAITSPATHEYNCFAWAAGDTEKCWWPDANDQYYWPSAIPRVETKEAFINAYKSLGFTVCDNAGYEDGYERVAIYFHRDGRPTHAARQLKSGQWTSKLGTWEDIEHTKLNGVEGEHYGIAVIFMKRPK